MFENEAKGWFGSYSLAGKNSAEKYHSIVHKEEILGNEYRKIKAKDIFSPDDSIVLETIDDNFDIFKVYSKEKKKNELFTDRKIKKPNIIDKYKYHNKHISEGNRVKNNSESNFTRYNPKYEYIWPKLVSGPSWKFIKGREKKRKKLDKKDYYINNTIFSSSSSKCLVNMDKTTQRGNINVFKDIRIRNDKKFDKTSDHNDSNKEKNKKKREKTFKNNSMKNIKSKTIKNLETDENSNKNINNISIRSYKSKSKRNIFTPNNSKKNLIKALDFQRTISREQREKASEKKIHPIPFILPNYDLIRERIKSVVIYEKPKKHTPRIKYIEGLNSGITYQPDIAINKIDNHTEVKSPNFRLMTSRIDKKNCKLPTYMQNIYDRKSVDTITEKSLKLNNFSNGHFLSPSNSFLPKKSYNNFVNLNLLYNDLHCKSKDNEIIKHRNMLKTSLSFYHKNFDELIKEGALNKFDNVTFKTIKRKRKLDHIDLEKFLMNFENIDDD